MADPISPLPNLSQYNYEIGDTVEVVTKQNAINADIDKLGQSINDTVQSINEDVDFVETARNELDAEQIVHAPGSGLPNEAGNAYERDVGEESGNLMEVGAFGLGELTNFAGFRESYSNQFMGREQVEQGDVLLLCPRNTPYNGIRGVLRISRRFNTSTSDRMLTVDIDHVVADNGTNNTQSFIRESDFTRSQVVYCTHEGQEWVGLLNTSPATGAPLRLGLVHFQGILLASDESIREKMFTRALAEELSDVTEAFSDNPRYRFNQYRVYAQSNILGTVSQDNGTPTGAIIERGSNDDGDYVKFADGTLLMFSPEHEVDATDKTGELYYTQFSEVAVWDYPASPVGTPHVEVMKSDSISVFWGNARIIGTSQCEMRLISPTERTQKLPVRAIAWSSWF